MNNSEYFSNKEYVNFSSLKHYKQSPAYFKYMQENPQKSTEEMNFGSAFHCLVLEPEKFDEQFFMLIDSARPEPDKTFGSKLNKEWRDNILKVNSDKIIISFDDFNKIQSMISILSTDKQIKELLSNGIAETPILTELNNVKIKCKPDYKSINYIIDLKTTTKGNSTPQQFCKTIANFMYHVQAALYLDACKEDDFFDRKFIIIAQEKEPPFLFSKFLLSENTISVGRYEYVNLLSIHKHCIDSNQWEGNDIYCNTDNGLIEIELPKWAITETNFIL
jgi:exodeoxyribonuclease VIII